jgi:sarcosine oxidase subunit alpha
VRKAAGVCDVSTLGKIDVQGGDAGEFLNRVYINQFSSLPVGKARYGLMLREDGFVMDDGTTARLTERQYIMTTTTANAGRVMQHLQFCHQVLWPNLDVQLTSICEQWAQYAIAGPRARDVLRKLVDAQFDLSNTGFPFLAAASLTIRKGIPARLFRISFSGELAYELAVPAREAQATLQAIHSAGKEFGLIPYGTEAMSVLRIEKGHVAGNELNGHTTAGDLGLGKMMSSKKDFVGATLARRPALQDPSRPTLTGFVAVRRRDRLCAGAHLFSPGTAISPTTDEGYLTSVAFSPALESWIGLGLLRNGPQRYGERIRVWDPMRGGDFEAEIRNPVFVDLEGRRVHG